MNFRLNFGVFLRLFVQYLSSTEEAEAFLCSRGHKDQTKQEATPTFLSRRRSHSHPASLPDGVRLPGTRCRELFLFVIDVVRQIQTLRRFFVVVNAFRGVGLLIYTKRSPHLFQMAALYSGFCKTFLYLSISIYFVL